MKNKALKRIGVGIFIAGIASTSYSMAEGFYVGAQAGKTFTHNQPVTLSTCGVNTAVIGTNGNLQVAAGCPNAGSQVPANVVATSTQTFHPANTGVGGRLFVGYNVTKYWGWEAGFTHFGLTTIKVPTTPPLTIGNPVGSPAITENAFDFVVKGMPPYTLWGFSAYGKLGISILKQGKAGTFIDSFNANTSNVFYTNPANGTAFAGQVYHGIFVNGQRAVTYVRPTAGIGITYDINQNVQAELTLARVFGGGGLQPADLVGLGVSYHFVDKYCGQFLC